MAPKHKAQNPIKDTKADKKRDQKKKENSTFCKEEDRTTKSNSEGKNNIDTKVETKVITSLKRETLFPEYSDENLNSNKAEFPNLQLNKLIQKKSILSLQGAIKWKIYLFPSYQKISLVTKTTQQYFGFDLVEEGTERTF